MPFERRPKILAVDDDLVWLEQIPLILESIGDVETASSIDAAVDAIQDKFFDIVLLDLNFEHDRRTGIDVFQRIHAMDKGVSVVVISGETNPARLIEVFNAGVTRFIPKPADNDHIRTTVRRVIEDRDEERRVLSGGLQSRASNLKNPLLGMSVAISNLRRDVDRALAYGAKDILILGETGTGKELLARFIAHAMDPLGRMIAIHCGAISDGIAESELFGHTKGAFTGADKDRIGAFEAAAGGFVFLDEVGEMPSHQQAKLLRVLQERTVQRVGSFDERKANFRTISATHRNLEGAVQSGAFREDLYFRLAKVVLRIPALRDRREDIPFLIRAMLAEDPDTKTIQFTDEAMRLMKLYDWPGNSRQLRAVLDQLALRSPNKVIREKEVVVILPETAACAPKAMARSILGTGSSKLIAEERKKFEEALSKSRGDRTKAADLLGLSRATYYRRAKELGLKGSKLR